MLVALAVLAAPAAGQRVDIDDLAFKLEEAKPADKDEALRRLERTMSPKAALPVLSLLAYNDENVLPTTKALALKIAMRLADKDALPALREMLKSADVQVREWAVRVLPFCETAESVEMLKAAARDPERRVRLAAIESLGNASDPGLAAWLDELAANPDSGIAGAYRALLALG